MKSTDLDCRANFKVRYIEECGIDDGWLHRQLHEIVKLTEANDSGGMGCAGLPFRSGWYGLHVLVRNAGNL